MRRRERAFKQALCWLALPGLLLASDPAQVQPAAPTADARPSAQQVVVPDAERIILLIRTTLLTLNDAVQTGNFTVLRDVAAPGFRETNSAARLAGIFATLAQRGVDLAPVSIMAPQLAETPSIDPKTGMLRLKGQFPGQPVRIDFDLFYQPVGGRWRLFGLSVQPVPVAADTRSAAPPPEVGAGKFAPGTQISPAGKKAEPARK